MDEYKALTYIVLKEVRRNPGDTIPASDFSGQEEIDALVKDGAISLDLDSPLHPDHVGTLGFEVDKGTGTDG